MSHVHTLPTTFEILWLCVPSTYGTCIKPFSRASNHISIRKKVMDYPHQYSLHIWWTQVTFPSFSDYYQPIIGTICLHCSSNLTFNQPINTSKSLRSCCKKVWQHPSLLYYFTLLQKDLVAPFFKTLCSPTQNYTLLSTIKITIQFFILVKPLVHHLSIPLCSGSTMHALHSCFSTFNW